MPQVLPESLTQRVADRLLELLHSATHSKSVQHFQRASLLRDIETIQKTDAQNAFLLRSILATLDGDIDEAERNVECARKLNAPGAAQQHLFALSNLGYAARALHVARTEMRPGVPELSNMIRAVMPVGIAQTAARVIDEAQLASQALCAAGNLAIDMARRIARSLELAGRTEDELVAILDVAGEAMRAKQLLWLDRMPHVITLTGAEGDDCAPGVHYLYRVAVSPREAAAMTSDIGWKLIERELDRPGLSVAFVGSKADAISA